MSASEPMLSIADILAALKRQRWIIIIATVSFLLAGILYSVLSKPLYVATVVVQPATEGQSGSLSGLASRFGAMASLAGINLGGADGGKEAYLAVLKSRDLAVLFIHDKKLLPYLFPEKWNAEAGDWLPLDNGFVAGTARAFSNLLATVSRDEGRKELRAEPTAWRAYEKFKEVRRIAVNDTTGIVSVSMKFRDPALAKQWANDYIAFANEKIREKAVSDASMAYEYLNKKAEEVGNADLRSSIFQLMQSQLETMTLASARDEYAFKVVDPATYPEERSHPQRALIVILSVLAGFLAGVFLGLAREFNVSAQRKTIATSTA